MAARSHSVAREGIIAGVIGATGVAVWFLILDTMSGRPLFTPTVLGSALMSVFGSSPETNFVYAAGYTVFHYAAFIVVGLIASVVVHVAETSPSVLAGFLILFVAFEIGFHGLVALLQETTVLGNFAWYNVMAGNLIAAALMGIYLWRAHPALVGELRRALDGTGE